MRILVSSLLSIFCLLSACDGSSITGYGDNEEGVLATVNDIVINIKDIEMLYDMQTVSNDSIRKPLSLSELHTEYAQLTFLFIQQIIVSKSLEERGIEIAHSSVEAVENLVRSEYDLEGEDAFENYLIQTGINIEYWREQLKARLELEALQKELLKDVIISGDEIIAYLIEHPEIEQIPARATFAILSSSSKSKLSYVKSSKDISLENLERQSVSIQPMLLDMENIPDDWVRTLDSLKPGEFSSTLTVKVKDADGYQEDVETIYQTFYLMERTPDLLLNPIDTYGLVEQALLNQKLPIIMEEWLAEELKRYEIKVVQQFLPENIPQYEGIQPLVLDSSM